MTRRSSKEEDSSHLGFVSMRSLDVLILSSSHGVLTWLHYSLFTEHFHKLAFPQENVCYQYAQFPLFWHCTYNSWTTFFQSSVSAVLSSKSGFPVKYWGTKLQMNVSGKRVSMVIEVSERVHPIGNRQSILGEAGRTRKPPWLHSSSSVSMTIWLLRDFWLLFLFSWTVLDFKRSTFLTGSSSIIL